MALVQLNKPIVTKKANTPFLTGKFLASLDSNGDTLFNKTIILVCAHDKDGAMGLIINKTEFPLTLNDLLIQLEMPAVESMKNPKIFAGGPVGNQSGFVIHDSKDFDEDTAHISDHLYLTASAKILEDISKDQGPENYKIVLGYTGWDAGQLETEILQNMWTLFDASHNTIFHMPCDTMWYNIFAENNINPNSLYKKTGNA